LRAHLPPGTAVTIPSTAIGTDAQGTFVWKRDAERPRRTPIQVLATSGADALVTGLVEQDAIASIVNLIAETEVKP
jgi:hypothetical protein